MPEIYMKTALTAGAAEGAEKEPLIIFSTFHRVLGSNSVISDLTLRSASNMLGSKHWVTCAR